MTNTTEQVTLKVGDEVRVFDGRSARGEPATVVKVGRKLVTVNGPATYSRDEVFRLDEQTFNGPAYGHGRWFKTFEQVAEGERMQAAMDVLTNAGISFGWRAIRFTVDQLEELAALVQGWTR